MDPFKQAVDRAHDVLRVLHYDRRGDHFVNVNRAGAEAIHTSTIATIVHAALNPPPVEQPVAAQQAQVQEALGHIEMLVDFAYEQGFHELGTDPVAIVRNALGYITKGRT